MASSYQGQCYKQRQISSFFFSPIERRRLVVDIVLAVYNVQVSIDG